MEEDQKYTPLFKEMRKIRANPLNKIRAELKKLKYNPNPFQEMLLLQDLSRWAIRSQRISIAKIAIDYTLIIAKREHSISDELTAMQLLAQLHHIQKDWQKEVVTWIACKKLSTEFKDQLGYITASFQIGTILYRNFQWMDAEEPYIDAIKAANEIKDRRAIADIATALGWLYIKTEKTSKAKEYIIYAEIIFKRLNLTTHLSFYLNQACLTYLDENYDDAIDTLNKALTIVINTRDIFSQYDILFFLGIIYRKLNKLIEAKACLTQIFQICDQIPEFNHRDQITTALLEINHLIEREYFGTRSNRLSFLYPP